MLTKLNLQSNGRPESRLGTPPPAPTRPSSTDTTAPTIPRNLANREAATALTNAFSPFRRRRDGGGTNQVELRSYISQLLRPSEPLRCIMPGFPCKSPNPDSVFGPDADAAEATAVRELERLATALNTAYSDGVEIWIIQDADLFPRTPVVRSAAAVDRYSRQVASFTTHPAIKWIRVGDVLAEAATHSSGIALIEQRYLEDPDDLHDRLSTDPQLLRTYRALHAFLQNEAPTVPGRSGRAHRRAISAAALDQLARSRALSALMADEFDGYLRLSGRGYGPQERRVGINLIPGNDTAGMPWWHCLVERRDGSLDLIKRKEGMALGYSIVEGEHGPYFQEPQ